MNNERNFEMKWKPIDNNSQTVWERIVNESVASTLKRIGASIVNEMALPLKTFRQRVDGLRFQLIENWCLLKYCQLYSQNNVNIDHWGSEFLACAKNIRDFEIKGGINKQKTINKMFISDYDYNQSRKILPIIQDKFDIEKIHDNTQRAAVATEFSGSSCMTVGGFPLHKFAWPLFYGLLSRSSGPRNFD